jgi:glycosyltransferase involved in cell wall biosynthesis
MREEIIRYARVDASKVVTIRNPVNVASISRLSETDNPFEEAGAGAKHIVAVGRLEHQKGFDILIDAFALFLSRHPESLLYLAGEGTLRTALQEQAEKLGIADRVRFIGYQDNPYPLMRYADLFVLASRFEGFPNVLLEALACKAKVVAADCPNGPREILSRIEYGLLVQPEDPRSLADGMLRSLDTEQIGSEGYKRAIDYDCRVITSKYEKLLMN